MPGLAELTRKALTFLDSRIKAATASVVSAIEKKEFKADTSGLNAAASGMQRAAKVIEASSKRELKASVQVKQDNRDVVSAIKALKLPKTELKPLVTAVQGLQRSVDKQSDQNTVSRLERVERAVLDLGQLFANFKFPNTFMLEEQQLRRLVGTMKGGTVLSGGGGSGRASKVLVANVAMDDANTEYSYTFPANTVGYSLKLRANDRQFRYSWTEGDIAAGTYKTTPHNYVEDRSGMLELSGKTIYFLDPDNASNVLEVEVYQM